MNTDTPETNSAFKFWPCEQMELVDAEFARKLERERDEARKQLAGWNALSMLGDTPEKVWDAWRKKVIKTQKYIREMAYWRDKANKTIPSASVEEVRDIFNSYR